MNAKEQPMASILEELEKHCFEHEIMTIALLCKYVVYNNLL
jgi:hypothetical protein